MVMMHKLNSPQANDSIKALLILKRYSWAFPVPLILPSFPKAAMLSLLAFWRVIFRPAWCTITPGPLHSKNHTVRSGRMIRPWQCSRLAPASSQSLQFDSKPIYFVHNFCHDTLFLRSTPYLAAWRPYLALPSYLSKKISEHKINLS